MQFICPHEGLPFILLANAFDESSGTGADKDRVANANVAIAGTIHFIKTSRLKDRMVHLPRRCDNCSCPNGDGWYRKRERPPLRHPSEGRVGRGAGSRLPDWVNMTAARPISQLRKRATRSQGTQGWI